MLLIRTLIGTALVGGGANAFNQYLERAEDAKMGRTQKRPLVSGVLKPAEALGFAWAISVVGVAYLWLKVNTVAALMGLAVLAAYLWAYTPLKKRTSLNTYVGAVAGALPVFVGWAAARNSLDLKAWSFFAVLFMWQMPHFFAISWFYREDYRRGGFRMLASEDESGKKTGVSLIVTSILLFILSFAPSMTGLSGSLYVTAAAVSGLFFLGFALYTGTHRMHYARELGMASIVYLCVLNIFLFFDKI
jgi:protoheme IX farnesyltransferase